MFTKQVNRDPVVVQKKEFIENLLGIKDQFQGVVDSLFQHGPEIRFTDPDVPGEDVQKPGEGFCYLRMIKIKVGMPEVLHMGIPILIDLEENKIIDLLMRGEFQDFLTGNGATTENMPVQQGGLDISYQAVQGLFR